MKFTSHDSRQLLKGEVCIEGEQHYGVIVKTIHQARALYNWPSASLALTTYAQVPISSQCMTNMLKVNYAYLPHFVPGNSMAYSLLQSHSFHFLNRGHVSLLYRHSSAYA